MHKTSIVAYRKLSNGQFAVLVRCCSDAGSDSWLTVAAEVAANPSRLKISLGGHHASVADLHDASQRAEENIKALVPS
jgi:hypothetical protein